MTLEETEGFKEKWNINIKRVYKAVKANDIPMIVKELTHLENSLNCIPTSAPKEISQAVENDIERVDDLDEAMDLFIECKDTKIDPDNLLDIMRARVAVGALLRFIKEKGN